MVDNTALGSIGLQERVMVDPLKACSMYGAFEVCAANRDIVPLIHGPGGCPCFMFMTMTTSPNFEGFSDLRFPTTSLCHKDIVYGGEKKLEENIHRVIELFTPKMIMVLGSCTAGIIGDDIHQVAERMTKRYGIPILAVDTRSSQWDLLEGRIAAQKVIIRNIMEDKGVKKEKAVNLLGICAGDYNWRGDVLEFKRMLRDIIGLEVNSVFPAAESLQEIKQAPQASLNIVISPEYGLDAAQEMEKLFGVPYLVVGSPYGLTATEEWLRSVSKFLGMYDNRVEEVISKEAREAARYIIPQFVSFGHVRMLRGIPTALLGEASRLMGLINFITRELGMRPVLVGLKVSTPDFKERLEKLREELSLDYILLEDIKSMEDIVTALGRVKVDFLFGSDLDRKIGAKILRTGAFVGITSPIYFKVNTTYRPYIGFRGSVYLFEEILNARLEMYQSERPYGSFWDLLP